ncbi:hypothetical protein TNCV_1855071 [Trichonephila clavipes]|nr:hypothetical protein TNCV_1855071 [Trichonephila clavipes]
MWGDKLGDHGNPAPNNPVWQPYRGIVTLCIECFSRTLRIFLDLSISRLFWQVQEVSDRKVYKTQFSIVADANQSDSQTKACQLAAFRADAADILQTLPETQRLDFDASSLMLWSYASERNV